MKLNYPTVLPSKPASLSQIVALPIVKNGDVRLSNLADLYVVNIGETAFALYSVITILNILAYNLLHMIILTGFGIKGQRHSHRFPVVTDRKCCSMISM